MPTIHLVVKLFEHENYGGQYRYLYKDVTDFGTEGFHDKVSSVLVYRGPHYQLGDTVRFYEHPNYTGGHLELQPGYYPNIHVEPYNFGDKMSSADFYPTWDIPTAEPTGLIVTVYEHPNFGGQNRTFLYTEQNFGIVGFHDKVSSLRIEAGPNYAPDRKYVANFYEHSNFGGGMLQPGNFGPWTAISNIHNSPYLFGDKMSSLRITRV